MQTHHANVSYPCDSTTGDHRYIILARQSDGRFDIAAFQYSVASDIGEEQGRDASILEPARHIGNGHVGSLRPAFRRDEAVARIDSHPDPARELTCCVLHEFRVLERGRADHHTRYTQVKPAPQAGPFTDAPANLPKTGQRHIAATPT